MKKIERKKDIKDKVDIKYLGIPNICFSLTDKDDDREIEYSKQRKTMGFDESETWSLCDTISNFIIPRLQFFHDYVPTVKGEWKTEINKMLIAFKLVARDNGGQIFTDEEKQQLEEGMELFKKYFLHLWW